MGRRILVVDDEKLIVKGIKFSLMQDDYTVDCAYDGQEALDMAKKTEYDVVLLDVMLPELSGFEVCQAIREFSNMPIIMLTAKGDDMDKILGLEYGADDYITKPFNILEVKARIKAIIRRSSRKEVVEEKAQIIESSGLKVDCESRRVYTDDKEVNLTAKEFDLLKLLISNPNKVYSRESLLKKVWGYDYPGDVRTVDVHIRRLREKIERDSGEPEYIHTKWGVGYYFQS
ncbi:MAG: response regulator transcription factor [Lachnospiraceae bacterium]|nr:response regulator transcription factor [Lachnospiraceae bacterium]